MKRNAILSVSGLLLAGALAAMGGCAGASRTAGQAPLRTDAAQPVLKGKVVEALNAGGYTYICLERDGKKVWAAVPAVTVNIGEELELQPGFEKGPFTSPTLNRTFDQLIFSAGPVAKSSAQPVGMPSGHPALPAMPGQKNVAAPAATGPMAEKPFYAGKVVETITAGNYVYLCLEKDGKLSWAAIPRAEVNVGDEVEVQPGTEMGKFTSPSLPNRTFDNIIFSTGIVLKK